MTLSVGLIGCGHISTTHLTAWRRVPGCVVVGVFDLDRELAERQAGRFRTGRVFDSAEQLIAECEVVDVCTPPQTHADLALAAVAAGRHLLIEKPLVTRIDDWRRLRAALAESTGGLTVVHNLKYAASYLAARRWIDEGRIGSVIRVTRRFLTHPSRDRMLGGRHWSHDLPGGRWSETLPHELYVIHDLLGDLPVTGVAARRTATAPTGAPADEVTVTLGDGRGMATIEYSANHRPNLRTLEIHGTRGSIEIDLLSDRARRRSRRDRPWRRLVGGPHLEAASTLAGALPDRIGYMARRLTGRSAHARLIEAAGLHFRGSGPPPTPFEEISYVVEGTALIGSEIARQVSS